VALRERCRSLGIESYFVLRPGAVFGVAAVAVVVAAAVVVVVVVAAAAVAVVVDAAVVVVVAAGAAGAAADDDSRAPWTTTFPHSRWEAMWSQRLSKGPPFLYLTCAMIRWPRQDGWELGTSLPPPYWMVTLRYRPRADLGVGKRRDSRLISYLCQEI